jgi:DnaJ-domain-containing protein 1
MTDYFRLLGQPRRPWVDQQKLKDAFHARTLQAHPDVTASSAADASSFASFNEAYRTLRQPKLRIDHLLGVENAAPDTAALVISGSLEALFPAITDATQRLKEVLAKVQGSRSALSRGLLQRDVAKLQAEIDRLRDRLSRIETEAVDELRAIDGRWDSRSATDIQALHRLSSTFGYLTRWSTQLDEARFQLEQT